MYQVLTSQICPSLKLSTKLVYLDSSSVSSIHLLLVEVALYDRASSLRAPETVAITTTIIYHSLWNHCITANVNETHNEICTAIRTTTKTLHQISAEAELHGILSYYYCCSLSVPRHNLSFGSRAFFVSQLPKYGIPYRLTFCSLKHSLHLDVI